MDRSEICLWITCAISSHSDEDSQIPDSAEIFGRNGNWTFWGTFIYRRVSHLRTVCVCAERPCHNPDPMNHLQNFAAVLVSVLMYAEPEDDCEDGVLGPGSDRHSMLDDIAARHPRTPHEPGWFE